MRIIPVIDLLGGNVVRGVAGRRSEYRPIESRLVEGSRPPDVAAAFLRLGLSHIYLADLDAIVARGTRREPSWDAYRSLLDLGAALWIDAGLGEEAASRAMATFEHRGRAIDGVVAGLETLADETALANIVRAVGVERLIFSLDLKEGRPFTDSAAWRNRSPLDCAETALAAGVRRTIVLDVAAVGVAGGIATLELCRALRRNAPAVEIVSGGGVRGADDLERLADAGCDGALVASALHDGRLSETDIARFST